MSRLFPAVIMCFVLAAPAVADGWGPWEPPVSQPGQQQSDSALQGAIRFFQRHISPVDGPRCPMYPTCSGYALQAVGKHGPVLGTFQFVDRLYREGDRKHEQNHPINHRGYLRFYDPLQSNDFWLQTEPE